MSIAGRPAFDWEMEPPNGEGRAGGYLAHLRERGYVRASMPEIIDRIAAKYNLDQTSHWHSSMHMAIDPGARRMGFALRYGSGPEGIRDAINQHMEDTTMNKPRITVEFEADSLLDLVHILLDINDDESLTITDIGTSGIAPDPISEPEADPDAPVMVKLQRITGQEDIDHYLSRAVARVPVPEVEITYVSDISGERTIRKAKPLSAVWVRGRKLFSVTDVRSGGTRSFYLDNIEAVEGPVL